MDNGVGAGARRPLWMPALPQYVLLTPAFLHSSPSFPQEPDDQDLYITVYDSDFVNVKASLSLFPQPI